MCVWGERVVCVCVCVCVSVVCVCVCVMGRKGLTRDTHPSLQSFRYLCVGAERGGEEGGV